MSRHFVPARYNSAKGDDRSERIVADYCAYRFFWCNYRHADCLPRGAGLVVRRQVFESFARGLESDSLRQQLGRNGASLADDSCLTRLGAFARFPAMNPIAQSFNEAGRRGRQRAWRFVRSLSAS